MPERTEPTAAKEYDVALSFAGEDREFVEQVAMALRRKGLKVFYDRFEEADLVGRNLVDHLSEVYQHKAVVCVLFVSQAYARKPYPRLERQAAQSTALSRDEPYIIPVRLDDSEIPGLLPTVAYLSGKSPDAVATIVAAKLLLREPRDARTLGMGRGDAVVIRFDSLLQPDLGSFRKSLEGFDHWSRDKLSSVPIEIALPAALRWYLESAHNFRASKEWTSASISDEARRQFAELHDSRIPKLIDKMMHGVQLLISRYSETDTRRLESVVRRFLIAKIVILCRLLIDMQLVGMAAPEWVTLFSECAHVWSDWIMYGLSYAAFLDGDERFFWIDADGYLEAPNLLSIHRYRLYVPAELAVSGDEKLSPETFDKFFAVQLLESELSRDDYPLSSLVDWPQHLKWTIRGEWAIETSHFDQVSTSNSRGKDLYPSFVRLRDQLLKDTQPNSKVERWLVRSRLSRLVRDTENFEHLLKL